mgnify:CR=1 FL=1
MKLHLNVNGKNMECEIEGHETLLEVLRDRFGLTGTKKGCGEGVCGACTVLLNGLPAASCIISAFAIEGASVETIEGITPEQGLSSLQKAFIERGAVQCGYCTPGFIVSGHHYLKNNDVVSPAGIRRALSGNLCRCTGYKKIEEAMLSAAEALGKRMKK